MTVQYHMASCAKGIEHDQITGGSMPGSLPLYYISRPAPKNWFGLENLGIEFM